MAMNRKTLRMVISATAFQALLVIMVWQSSSALTLLEQYESLLVSIEGFNSFGSTICSSGLEFVSALANPSVRRMVVSAEIHITESDFSAYKIYVERNISVCGMYPEREAWPLLDWGFVRAVVGRCTSRSVGSAGRLGALFNIWTS